MIQIKKNEYGEIVITGANQLYNEIEQAQPTSRQLDGSRDHGYNCEYEGYGTCLGLPVKAVYLLDDEDMQDSDGDEYEDEGSYDWDDALNNGRIIVDVDSVDMTDDLYQALLQATI